MPAVEKSLVFLNASAHSSLQRGEYDRAKALARRACWLANRHGLLFHLGWNLLQISSIDLEASTSNIMSVECALPPLLECLDLSERYSMDPLRAVALATLSKVLLCMGRYKKARAMLRAAIPLVMQHGHLWFQGESYLTLAKCYLAESSKAVSEADDNIGDEGADSVGKRKRGQHRCQKKRRDSAALKLRETALVELEKSAHCFEQIEDVRRLRQVYYLQARVFQLLPKNSKNKRDEAARKFVELTSHMRKRAGVAVPSCAQGVMITDMRELQRCVSMKQRR